MPHFAINSVFEIAEMAEEGHSSGQRGRVDDR